MCWGGKSGRFCSSVMAQGPGLGRVCGPSISKVKSRARPRGGQDLPPHWRGDRHGNCAAELGAGLSTGLRTERRLPLRLEIRGPPSLDSTSYFICAFISLAGGTPTQENSLALHPRPALSHCKEARYLPGTLGLFFSCFFVNHTGAKSCGIF